MQSISKKRLIVFAFALTSLTLIAFGNTPVALSNGPETGAYMEYIMISVDCNTASLSLACNLFSINSSLIHYPSGVNLNNSHLRNCTAVSVMFNGTGSTLTFMFNETSHANAKSNADVMIDSMNSAFDVTFTHESTIGYPIPYPQVWVIYSAEGKPNMTTFLGSLKTECVDPDVCGFSEALPYLFTYAEDEMITLTAINVTEIWSCTLTAGYNTSIATGSGSHTIDVLHYLGGISYLQPSEYANFTGYYMWSYIFVAVNSTDTISFVECQPDEVMIPIFEAGWYVPEKGPNTVSGTFYFGNEPFIGEVITFTFGGTVIPEFTPLTTILLIAFVSTILLYLHKRYKAIA